MRAITPVGLRYFVAGISNPVVQLCDNTFEGYQRVAAWPQRTLKMIWQAVLHMRHDMQTANCALFHQRHLQGPFSDETEAYFLCEIGHRIPCPVLPASRPRRKSKVWNDETTIAAESHKVAWTDDSEKLDTRSRFSPAAK